MEKIRLNGAKMLDKAKTHAYLKRKLNLPDYYGNNLDALWDCLSTDVSGKTIAIYKTDHITKNLGAYGESIIKLFQKAAQENECIQVEFEREES